MNKMIFCLLLLFPCFGYAQYKMEKSEPIHGPQDVFHKVLMIKGGKTFYFKRIRQHKKCVLEVSVYDTNRKLANKSILSGPWSKRNSQSIAFNGVYDINGEPVVFVTLAHHMTQTQYRLRLNPDDGTLLKEDLVGDISFKRPINVVGNTFASMPGSVHVVKDPTSDAYAVIFFNPDPNARLFKAYHYDGKHNLINSGSFTGIDRVGSKTMYLDACVNGSKNVFIAYHDYVHVDGGIGNMLNMNNPPGILGIAKLENGDSTFILKDVKIVDDIKEPKAQILYTSQNNSLRIITNVFVKYLRGMTQAYSTFLVEVDALSLTTKSVKEISNRQINAFVDNNMLDKDSYTGIAQGLIENKDKSITILKQEFTSGKKTDRLGISLFSNQDETGYAIDDMPVTINYVKPFYLASKYQTISTSSYQYFVPYYINSPSNKMYILLNNKLNSLDASRRQKSKQMNTICYTFKNGNMASDFLFGAPKNRKQGTKCSLEAVCTDDNGTIATVMQFQKRHRKQSRLVWIHFD